MNRLQTATIKHYNRMIEFALTRPSKEKPSPSLMEDAIGEDWGGFYCAYCKKYGNTVFSCSQCELSPLNFKQKIYTDMTCSHIMCCNGLWFKMATAKTWRTWIKYARLIIEFVKENG